MTRIIMRNYKCAICGKESGQKVMLSSHSFGYPDLDFRPARALGGLPLYNIMECTSCGYCNRDLDELKFKDVARIVKSDEYQDLRKKLKGSRASKFFLSAYLDDYNENYNTAWLSYLNAAWCYDDSYDSLMSDVSRKKAIDDLLKTAYKESFNRCAILVDMLRRVREFEKAIVYCDEFLKTFKDKENVKIFKVQKELCEAKDSKIHTTGLLIDKENDNK